MADCCWSLCKSFVWSPDSRKKIFGCNYSLKTASLQEAQPGAGAMEVDNSVAEAAAVVVADR